MKLGGYHDTRLSTLMKSTPKKKSVRWDLLVLDKHLCLPHDRHPLLQNGRQFPTMILTWIWPLRQNPLGHQEAGMSSISRLKCGMTSPSRTVLHQPPATQPTQLTVCQSPRRNYRQRPRIKARMRTCGTSQTNCKLRRNQLRTALQRGHPCLLTMTIGIVCTRRRGSNYIYFTLDYLMGAKGYFYPCPPQIYEAVSPSGVFPSCGSRYSRGAQSTHLPEAFPLATRSMMLGCEQVTAWTAVILSGLVSQRINKGMMKWTHFELSESFASGSPLAEKMLRE